MAEIKNFGKRAGYNRVSVPPGKPGKPGKSREKIIPPGKPGKSREFLENLIPAGKNEIFLLFLVFVPLEGVFITKI